MNEKIKDPKYRIGDVVMAKTKRGFVDFYFVAKISGALLPEDRSKGWKYCFVETGVRLIDFCAVTESEIIKKVEQKD